MQIGKYKDTPAKRRFWESVEKCGEAVAKMSAWERNCPVCALAKKVGRR